jgi:UDPglucose 6-dehydrogenase
MRGRIVVDLRNVFDPIAMRGAGFAYHGIGRAQADTVKEATFSK